MTDMPVSGPHRTYVRRTPTGAELDVSAFVEVLLVQLAQDFAEDPQAMAEELEELAAADSSSSFQTSHGGDDAPATHERDAMVQDLLDRIGGGKLPVYGDQVGRLAQALLAASTPVPVPQQRTAGEAA